MAKNLRRTSPRLSEITNRRNLEAGHGSPMRWPTARSDRALPSMLAARRKRGPCLLCAGEKVWLLYINPAVSIFEVVVPTFHRLHPEGVPGDGSRMMLPLAVRAQGASKAKQ